MTTATYAPAGLLPFGVQPGVSSFAAQYPQHQYQQHQAALVQAALAQQLAPYGIFGDAHNGGQVGSIIDQLGGLQPFAAQPGMLHPQQVQQLQQAAQQLQQLQQAAQQLQQLQQAQQVAQAQQAIAQQAIAQQAIAQHAVARQLQQNPIQQAQHAPYGIGGNNVGGLFGNPYAGGVPPFQGTPNPWMSYQQQPMWN